MIPTRREKEKLVIDLAEKGRTTREIAKAVRISLGDIGKILKKYNGEECYDENLSTPSKAFLMFERGQNPLYVAIRLNLDTDTTLNLHKNYLRLKGLEKYNQLLEELGPDLPIFVHLYQILKNNDHLTREFIHDFINQHNTLGELWVEVMELNDFIVKLHDKKLALEREIEHIMKKYYLQLQRTGLRRRYLTPPSETGF